VEILVLPSNLAEHIHNGTEMECHSVHVKRNFSGAENDGNQKVIFQRLDNLDSSFPPKTVLFIALEPRPCQVQSV
jgi:hypothetical protein